MNPAGWYQDKGEPWLDRYWDGRKWTRETRPHLGVTPPFREMLPARQGQAAPLGGQHAASSQQRERSTVAVVVLGVLGVLGILPVAIAMVFFSSLGNSSGASGPTRSPSAAPESTADDTVAEGSPTSPTDQTEDSVPSESCLSAARSLLEAEAELNRTHPAVNGGGGSYDDYEQQLDAIFEPMYWACESPQDWWATAQVEPAMAGNLIAANLDPAWIEGWCAGRSDAPPMCEGWETFVASQG